jgi:hypothetical protein
VSWPRHLGVLIGGNGYAEMKSFVGLLDHSLDPGFCQRCNCTMKKSRFEITDAFTFLTQDVFYVFRITCTVQESNLQEMPHY